MASSSASPPGNSHSSNSPSPNKRVAKTIVSLNNIGKDFGKVTALDGVSIDIREGEIFALLGPSGCGKSTLLRIISGFETPSRGELLLDGEDMARMPPNKRPVNMVFQSYAVFPHMNVSDNVAYGLKMDGVARDEINSRVSEALAQVHLEDFKERMPDQLSGGQMQRVALARALVKQPRVLLLDEPLSALDAKLRDAMRLELVKLQESVGVTFVIVTHDQSEALAMADRVAVLESGRLRQVDTPSALYQNPVDAFVADFIGSIHSFETTHIEFIDSTADTKGGSTAIVEAVELGKLSLELDAVPKRINAGTQLDKPAIIAFRPESVTVDLAHQNSPVTKPENNTLTFEGFLGDIAFQGQHSIVEITRGEYKSITAVVDNSALASLQEQPLGTPVLAHCAYNDLMLLPAG